MILPSARTLSSGSSDLRITMNPVGANTSPLRGDQPTRIVTEMPIIGVRADADTSTNLGEQIAKPNSQQLAVA
jgi:hypothetical protein